MIRFKKLIALAIVFLFAAAPLNASVGIYDDGVRVGVATDLNVAGGTTTLSGGRATITINDIDSGTIDGAVIGGTTPAAGSFTTLNATTSITLGGSTITDWGSVVSPWTDTGSTVTLNAAPTAVLVTYGTGVISSTGLSVGTADIALENAQTIDGGTNSSIIFGDNSDTATMAFSGNDIVLDTSDGGYIFTLTDATDGTVDFMLNNDADDYIQLSTTTNQPLINFVGCNGKITAASGTIDFDNEIITTTGTLGAGATTVTSLIIGDDTYDVAADDTFSMTSNDSAAILKVVSGGNDTDASIVLVADKDDDAADDWTISSIGSDNDLHFTNGTTLRLTMASTGAILTSSSVQIIDDVNLIMGTNSDWTVQYDEGVDNQLLFLTAGTSCTAITDPMFEVLVGAVPTANQQVFGVSKGTQASNTPLLTLDEDGDMTIAGALTQSGSTNFTQDDTTDGAVDGLTLIHSSSDNDSSDNDGISIALHLENDANSVEEFASIDAIATDVSNGAEDTDLVFSQYGAGVIQETLRLVAADAAAAGDYLQFTSNTSEENGIVDVMVIKLDTSGTPAANLGAGISIQIDDATPGVEEQASIDFQVTDSTTTAENCDIIVSANTIGTIREVYKIDTDNTATDNTLHTLTSWTLETNGVRDMLELVLDNTADTATDGFGAGISISMEDETDAAEQQASIDFVLTDAGSTTEDCDVVFSQNLAGAITESLRLDVDSGLTLVAANWALNFDEGESISTATDDTMVITSNDADFIVQIVSPLATDGDASIQLIADASANDGDDWEIMHAGATNDLTFRNDTGGSLATIMTLAETGILTLTGTAVFGGGQTRKEILYPSHIAFDDTAPPTLNTTEGGTGMVFEVLQFDSDGGTTGDDIVHIKWHVPDGYVVDSGRLNVIWSCESAETTGDDAVFDMTVNAVASGEAVDDTGTAFTEAADEQWTGTADLLFTTQLNFEVETIAVDDMVYISLWVDETASEFTDTIDVHALEFEYESTE